MKSFIIQVDKNWFNTDDIITNQNGVSVRVIKVYKYNLWRKFLNLLGIKFKLFNCIKVKEDESNN